MWCKRIANVKLPFPCVSDGDAYATTSPLWWTLNSSWETIWSKQVFHQGLLFLHIWCLFKHLNARLGSLCLTAFAIFFIDLTKRFTGKRSAAFIMELKIWLLSRAAHHSHLFPPCLCFFVHEFTDRDGPLFLSLLHFFTPVSCSAQACQATVACGPH